MGRVHQPVVLPLCLAYARAMQTRACNQRRPQPLSCCLDVHVFGIAFRGGHIPLLFQIRGLRRTNQRLPHSLLSQNRGISAETRRPNVHAGGIWAEPNASMSCGAVSAATLIEPRAWAVRAHL